MEQLRKTLHQVNRALKPVLLKLVEKIENRELVQVLQYCLQLKDSYDRALIVGICGDAFGGNWRLIMPALAAVELMDFSVIAIDDILDEAPRRMDRPTVHMKWDSKIAIIAASILKSLSVETMISLCHERQLSGRQTCRLLNLLESDHHHIYEGQYLDVTFETTNIKKLDVKQYLDMIKLTTGIQISSCAQIGALLAGCRRQQLNKVGDYGMLTGMIYQIRDDFIDYIADESLTNKTAFLDFQRKKKRLPLIMAYRYFPGQIEAVLKKPTITSRDRKEIVRLVSDDRVVESVSNIVDELKHEAIGKLRIIKNVKAKEVMEQVVNLGAEL